MHTHELVLSVLLLLFAFPAQAQDFDYQGELFSTVGFGRVGGMKAHWEEVEITV